MGGSVAGRNGNPPAGGGDDPKLEGKHATLWVKALKACESKLGRLPSNEDMVDFARSREGKFVRHLFPFDDLKASARKHWIALAGLYTRRVKIIYASDPKAAPVRARALYVVARADGQGKGIATLQQVASSKTMTEQVIEEALSSLRQFQIKYDSLNKLLRDPRLEMALKHTLLAAVALKEK